jgi:hypothetical protein
VLVALLAAASAGIHQTATIRVAGIVDAHWRGAYDILVRPPGTRLDLEQTGGLVEPNFVGFAGHGGISLDGLAAVRSVSGVELAAPIGFVGYVRGVAPNVIIELDHLPMKPTLFRLTAVTTTTDGLTRQPIQTETGEILLGPPAPGDNPAARWVTNLGDISASQEPEGTWLVDISTKRTLPGLAIPVIAVDPEAEDALLSGKAGFLTPLAGIGSGARTVGSFDTHKIDSGWPDLAGPLQAIRSSDWRWPSDRQLPVVPLIVSTRQTADLKVDLKVEQIGHAMDGYPDTGDVAAVEAAAGPGLTVVGSSSADAAAGLAPLRNPKLCVLWPGSSHACEAGLLFRGSSLDSRLVVRPTYSAASMTGPDSGAPAFVITQVGTVNPDGDPTVPDFRSTDSSATGLFPAYRQLKSVPLAVSSIPFQAHANIRQPFVLLPVGTFDATAVEVPSDPVDYVPLGAYDPSDTTYIAHPDGTAATAATMAYPLLPNGLVTTPPLAITDMPGAQALRGDSPIDAIRVRVSGVADFGPQSQARIEGVAGAIKKLGFDVDIVAGSSPQSVDIYVPAYHVDQNPPTDLGWVRQHWTTIGAAQRVSHGFDSSDLALLILTLAAAAIWAFALAALRAERKIREAAVLKAIGWGRAEILVWLTGDAAVGAAMIAVLAAVGFLLRGENPEALAVALGMAGVWLAAGVVAALDAIRRGRPVSLGATGGQEWLAAILPVGGTIAYAARAALARWPWVGATAVGLAAGSAAIALGLALIAGLGARIGPTLLASAAGAVAAGYQPLMLAAIGAGSLAFVVAGLRLDRRRRALEVLILSVSGWSTRETRTLLWLGLAPVALLAAALAFGTVLWLAGPLEAGDGGLPALGAAGLAISVLAWGGFAARDVVVGPGDLQ